MINNTNARLCDALSLVVESIPTPSGPLHLVRVNIHGIANCDCSTLRDEPLRDASLAPFLRNVDGVCIPQHRVDLIDILAIVHIFLDALEVARAECTPPRVLGALALQVLCDWMWVWEAKALGARIVDRTEACSRDGSIHVNIELLYQHGDEVPIPHHAGNHQRSHEVVVECRILIYSSLEQLLDSRHVSVNHGGLQCMKILRQAVPVVIT
mmetsp:Transcript_133804/g.244050  ORF Transcript_133804/g.244050 Transcript_133804/m.244050 type:complete len:211 (+) Transcript_133804:99-731(+)